MIVDVNTQGSSTQTISDSLTNSFTSPFTFSSNGNIRQKWFIAPVTNGGTDTVTITNSGGTPNSEDIDFLQYSGFIAIGQSQSNQVPPGSGSGTDRLSMNIQSNSMVFETGLIENSISLSCGTITMSDTQRANTCDLGSPALGMRYADYEHNGITQSSVTFTMSWAGWNTPAGFIHSIVEIQSNAPPPGNTVTTSCFGNCGSPAVTLANTNSTHLINFNQSITLLYQFSPGLNGFFINASANVAKTYSNGQIITLGVYIVSNCGQGQTPFSSQCPGTLVSSSSFVNPSKGKITMNVPGGATGLSNTQTAAVAISCVFAPCDINDTNTSVPMSQTSGNIPTIITQVSSLSSCACKTGLWTFISGNAVTGIPPPTTPSCQNNFAQLDCLIPGMVNGLCNVVSANCQASAALLWIIILTLLSFFLVTIGFSSAHITKFVGAGDVFVFIFLSWFFIFVGVGVIETFIVVFFLFTGALVFGKSIRNVGGL